MKLSSLHLLLYTLLSPICYGLIHYDGDDTGNLTDPGTGVPFYAVGRLCTEGGSLGATRGSCVYYSGKYVLTADHVADRTHATFDGTTFWEVDSLFTPIQFGASDMKLIKLVEDPGFQDVVLMSGSSIGNTGTIVGWGRNRDPAVADSSPGPTNTWKWHNNDSTIAKRWGTNAIDYTVAFSYSYQGKNYSYNSLVNDLDSNAGNNEAAVSLYDSGSGIFIEDGGTWKLAGIATFVLQQASGQSSFNNPGVDQNRFVEVSSYASDIANAVPDISTYGGWKTDNSLYGASAADSTDEDSDGISLIQEFAFGGKPNDKDRSIIPRPKLVEDNGSSYLEISVTRPTGLQGIIYTPQTTEDLSAWPSGSTGIVNDSPTPVNNGNGTETLTFRRSQAVTPSSEVFIRIKISEAP